MQAALQFPPFAVDDVVWHEKFGSGRVMSVPQETTNGLNERGWRVEVDFEQKGRTAVAASHLMLKSQVHQVDRIRNAMAAYGRLSVDTHRTLTDFGRRLLATVRMFLHRDKTLAQGVPPSGNWKPDTDYRDAMFSSHHESLLSLDPLDMGLALRIDNHNDDGACWIRLRLTLQKIGNGIVVSLGEGRLAEVPVEFSDEHLRGISAKLVDECVALFSDHVDHVTRGYYDGRGPIGFIWQSGGK